jgi:hypothetical protein
MAGYKTPTDCRAAPGDNAVDQQVGGMKALGLDFLILAACHGATPEVPPIALTPTEYNNTVRDLLGMPMDPSDWPDAPDIAAQMAPPKGEQAGLFGSAPVEFAPCPYRFPEEAGVEGFEGMADGQEPSPYRIEELQKAGVLFGAFTLVSPSFFTCENWASASSEEQQTCGWSSLSRFVQRAWRRPITEDETQRLQTFWDSQLQQGTPEEAVVLTAAAILQSPSFLYRIEGADRKKRRNWVVPLNDWEMASRLSCFLWDSMPDAPPG